LIKQQPTELSHYTLLALARLRQNRPADAFAVYRELGIPNGPFTPASVAVHAAVLEANGYDNEALREIVKVPGESLLPEEHDLFQKMTRKE
jgi:hypothetical protein